MRHSPKVDVRMERQTPLTSLRRLAVLPLLALAAMPFSARAGICEAPWMHDGGEVHFAMAGAAGIHASLRLDRVKQQTAGRCEANVTTDASAAAIGVPNQTRSSYRIVVKDDRAGVALDGKAKLAGSAGAATANGTLGVKGLESLAYAGVVAHDGQRLPGENYALDMQMQTGTRGMPSGMTMNVPSAKVTSTEKTVGKLTPLDTRLGRLSCWPVRYERTTHMGTITMGGRTIAPPAIAAQVTDWYCPDYALVMKQETVQNGHTAVVEVVSVK